jgi:hypothetical protein
MASSCAGSGLEGLACLPPIRCKFLSPTKTALDPYDLLNGG